MGFFFFFNTFFSSQIVNAHSKINRQLNKILFNSFQCNFTPSIHIKLNWTLEFNLQRHFPEIWFSIGNINEKMKSKKPLLIFRNTHLDIILNVQNVVPLRNEGDFRTLQCGRSEPQIQRLQDCRHTSCITRPRQNCARFQHKKNFSANVISHELSSNKNSLRDLKSYQSPMMLSRL